MIDLLRAKRNYRILKPYLTGSILDIGCGNCLIAELISKEHDIKCIDIVDSNKTRLPILLYDGKKLPFKDRCFDTSLLVYVLHHSFDPIYLLKEAARTTRKRIIVFEDVFDSGFELLLLKFFDLGNKLSNKDMPIPFNFKRHNDWLKIFNRFAQVKCEKIPMVLPRKQICYVLDLTNG